MLDSNNVPSTLIENMKIHRCMNSMLLYQISSYVIIVN